MNRLEMRSILVVDDDEDQLDILKECLATIGVEIITCGDGDQALEILRKRTVDAVLTDFRMPQKTGLDLLLEMRSEKIETPVVFFTGIRDMDIALQALRLGAVDFIHKPADLKEIVATATKAIEIGVRRRRLQLAYDAALLSDNDQKELELKEIERQKIMINLLQLKRTAG